jgi:hypothetical protein
VIARLAFQRTWAAFIIAGLGLVWVFLPATANPALSWVSLSMLIVIFVWAAVRLGLVAVVTAVFSARLLTIAPLSFRPGAWDADLALLVLAIVASMALFGLFAATRIRRAAVPA